MIDRLDRNILIATAVSIVTVVGINFTTSYQHIQSLGLKYGEDSYSAALMPVGIDGMLLALGFANLLAAKFLPLLRKPHKGAQRMLRFALGFGVAGTVAANGAYGAWWGQTGAILGMWSPVALFIAVEAGLFAYKVVSEYVAEQREQDALKPAQDAEQERRRKATEASKAWRERQKKRGERQAPQPAASHVPSVDNGQRMPEGSDAFATKAA